MRRNLGGPALVVAVLALFVALGDGAVAAGIVPLARHAITANTATNALKLGGKTPTQIKQALRGPTGATGPAGPAGAAGAAASTTVALRTQSFTVAEAGLDGDSTSVTVNCDSGQKAVGGGYTSDGTVGLAGGVLGTDSHPNAADNGWTLSVANLDGTAGHTGTVYAVCLG